MRRGARLLVPRRSYLELLRYARKVTRRADEAEDLLQTALLAAVEAGRADMTSADNRRWLLGALRKRAMFDARTAVRRRARESSVAVRDGAPDEGAVMPARFVEALPPSLKTTALLALTGHSKAEIAWLQRLSDAALRQRIADIRRRWRRIDGDRITEFAGLNGALNFGRVRRTLLGPVRRDGAVLASHDPDGHLFVVTSQNGRPRQQRVVSDPGEE